MVHDFHGLHHLHKRKRIHVKHEKYPHPDSMKRLMDKMIYAAGFLGPIFSIPQITNIWVHKQAAGVSVITWFSFLFTSLFWLVYGIIHKERAIIFTYCIWIVINSIIIVGAIIYG